MKNSLRAALFVPTIATVLLLQSLQACSTGTVRSQSDDGDYAVGEKVSAGLVRGKRVRHESQLEALASQTVPEGAVAVEEVESEDAGGVKKWNEIRSAVDPVGNATAARPPGNGATALGLVAGGAGEGPKRKISSDGAATGGTWNLLRGLHWQKETDQAIESPDETDAREGTRGSCSQPGMVRVEGNMKVGPIEGLQDQVCDNWISKQFPQRCALFNADKWKKVSAALKTKPMAFCIDRFEYPNVKGANPAVMMTYYESQKACAEVGKRLCTDEEWTFACEGEEALPYPYGYERDPDKCNADHGWTQYNASKLAQRTTETAMEEVDRLWKGLPSGSMGDCRSVFGVYDLTGNIDEWTQNKISGGKYKGSMKGGYWGPVRARCRPATIAHSEEHFFYQEGTRCCSDN